MILFLLLFACNKQTIYLMSGVDSRSNPLYNPTPNLAPIFKFGQHVNQPVDQPVNQPGQPVNQPISNLFQFGSREPVLSQGQTLESHSSVPVKKIKLPLIPLKKRNFTNISKDDSKEPNDETETIDDCDDQQIDHQNKKINLLLQKIDKHSKNITTLISIVNEQQEQLNQMFKELKDHISVLQLH